MVNLAPPLRQDITQGRFYVCILANDQHCPVSAAIVTLASILHRPYFTQCNENGAAAGFEFSVPGAISHLKQGEQFTLPLAKNELPYRGSIFLCQSNLSLGNRYLTSIMENKQLSPPRCGHTSLINIYEDHDSKIIARKLLSYS